MTDAKTPAAETSAAEAPPSPAQLLATLWHIRKSRAKKFLAYEQDREMKRLERQTWEQVEELVDPQPKKVDPVDRSIANKKRTARR